MFILVGNAPPVAADALRAAACAAPSGGEEMRPWLPCRSSVFSPDLLPALRSGLPKQVNRPPRPPWPQLPRKRFHDVWRCSGGTARCHRTG